MTHPMISIAGILLVGAMYGANAPGARAETVTCNINDVYDQNSKLASGVHGVVRFDFDKKTASVCWVDVCHAEVTMNMKPSRTGFEAYNGGWIVRVQNGQYIHALFNEKNEPFSTANGVCY